MNLSLKKIVEKVESNGENVWKDVKEEKILGVTKTVLEELELRRKMIQVDQMTEKPEKEDSIFGESFDLAVECLFGNNRST